MSDSESGVFRVGITHDVLTSKGQPIFGQEVFEWLNQPGLVWEYMEETPVIPAQTCRPLRCHLRHAGEVHA
jgi:hypothetical protein